MDFFVSLKKLFSRFEVKTLEEEKRKILDEVSLNEKKFLKHGIPESSYRELNALLHKKLIALDSEIAVGEINARVEGLVEKRGSMLQGERLEKLKALLKKIETAEKELAEARQLSMKRKISAEDFESIAKEKHFSVIDAEAEINSLYREEAKDVLREMERKLSMSEQESREAKAEEIAEDLVINIPHHQRRHAPPLPKKAVKKKAKKRR